MFFDWEELKTRFIIFISGAILIFTFSYISYITPSTPIHANHSNFNSTILSMEFARTPDDIKKIIGYTENEKHYEYIDRFANSVQLDYFFIFSYCFYFLTIFEYTIKLNLSNSAKLTRLLFYTMLIFCIIFDVIENYKLSEVLNSHSESLMELNLKNLALVSLFKWLSVFICCGILGVLLWLFKGSYLLNVAGLFLFTSFMIGLFGIGKIYLFEIAAIILFPGLLLVWIYSIPAIFKR